MEPKGSGKFLRRGKKKFRTEKRYPYFTVYQNCIFFYILEIRMNDDGIVEMLLVGVEHVFFL